jgi:hypothetical protein
MTIKKTVFFSYFKLIKKNINERTLVIGDTRRFASLQILERAKVTKKDTLIFWEIMLMVESITSSTRFYN